MASDPGLPSACLPLPRAPWRPLPRSRRSPHGPVLSPTHPPASPRTTSRRLWARPLLTTSPGAPAAPSRGVIPAGSRAGPRASGLGEYRTCSTFYQPYPVPCSHPSGVTLGPPGPTPKTEPSIPTSSFLATYPSENPVCSASSYLSKAPSFLPTAARLLETMVFPQSQAEHLHWLPSPWWSHSAGASASEGEASERPEPAHSRRAPAFGGCQAWGAPAMRPCSQSLLHPAELLLVSLMPHTLYSSPPGSPFLSGHTHAMSHSTPTA